MVVVDKQQQQLPQSPHWKEQPKEFPTTLWKVEFRCVFFGGCCCFEIVMPGEYNHTVSMLLDFAVFGLLLVSKVNCSACVTIVASWCSLVFSCLLCYSCCLMMAFMLCCFALGSFLCLVIVRVWVSGLRSDCRYQRISPRNSYFYQSCGTTRYMLSVFGLFPTCFCCCCCRGRVDEGKICKAAPRGRHVWWC